MAISSKKAPTSKKKSIKKTSVNQSKKTISKKVDIKKPKHTDIINKKDTSKKTAIKKSNLKKLEKDNKLRKINAKEIKSLISQGCTAVNWDNVLLCNVDISRIKDVNFLGKVCISNLNGYLRYHKDVDIFASIRRATLIDVSINGNVYINNVGAFISNYIIEDNVIIENVGTIYTKGETYFGNRTEVSTIIEGGGRSVRICNRLDSHTAYLIAMYREKTLMREKINDIIDKYTEQKYNTVGLIKNNAKIISARLIRNTHIDSFTTIENSDEITNATIISTEECPSYIGSAVIIKDSIILKGAYITDDVIISKSFVGEGVKLSKQFSCEDSLLFANCEGQHGEIYSIFASPYTVTHHKATLLIASYFSFFNAGSGTNQSNHMYKLGPCHHGFVERGGKTGSNSYILWPSRIGSFTTVIGSHYDNIDSSEFPFSYLLEYSNHKTILIPALNLFGLGICRDEVKWQDRDRRKGNKKDFVIFDVFSPYTVSKMLKAENLLFTFIKENISIGDVEPYFTYNKMYIKKSSLSKYMGLYTLAIDIYLHNTLLNKIKDCESFDEILSLLKVDNTEEFYSEWVDIAGLITPKNKVDNIIWALENNEINDIKELSNAWAKLYDLYRDDEWAWVVKMFKKRQMINFNTITNTQLRGVLENHHSYLKEASAIFENDVRKEFAIGKQVSFGVDDPLVRQDDFDAVRGTIDDNAFVIKYRKSIEEKMENIKNIISIINI